MDALLNWLWHGAVVAIATAGMLRLLDRSPAATRCVLCWVALLVTLVLPLAPVVPAAPTALEPLIAAAPLLTVPDAWWSSSAILASGWAIWASVSILRLVVAMMLVRRAKVRSQRFPPAVEPALPHWRRVRGAGRAARLVLSDRVQAGAVLGGGTAPMIAVRPALVSRLPAADLDRVIVHEWAHVQRRDDLAGLLRLIVRAVAGWHPAVWWLDRRLSLEQELACDEIVVHVTGGAKSYASCLVTLAALREGPANGLLAPGALSSAGLNRRVACLVTRQRAASQAWSRIAAPLTVVLLCLVAVGVVRVRVADAAVSETVARALQPVIRVMPTHLDAAPAHPEHTSAPPIARRAASASGSRSETPRAWRPAADVDVHVQPATELVANEEQAPPVTTPSPDDAVELEPIAHSLPLIPAVAPVTTSAGGAVASRSVWSPAADAGVALGRGSKNAGIAAAGAFTRLGKKIAGAF